MLLNSFIFNRDKLKHYDFMKHQQVVIDYTNMLSSSMTCLMLAFFGWVLIKLIQAMFMMPGYLDKEQKREALEEQLKRDKERPKDADDDDQTGSDPHGKRSDDSDEVGDDGRPNADNEDDDDDDEVFAEPTGEAPLLQKKIK